MWADRIQHSDSVTTISQLIDRYCLEVLPTKAKNTQDVQILFARQIKSVFGKLRLADIEPRDIYKYIDMRSKKTRNKDGKERGGQVTARREIALLSHAYTKAVQWGYVRSHPFKGEIRLDGERPRTRYIEDAEVIACLSLQPKNSGDKSPVIQAYIRLKLLTGLRQGDLLRLKLSDCLEDGLYVKTTKTARPIIYEWNDDLRAAVKNAIDIRPVKVSEFIFCTRRGESYVSDTGKTYGWKSIWRRFMVRVLAETEVKEHFTEHDLRAKCASDAETLEHARLLLAHTDSRTTQRVYRRKAEKVQPARAIE